MSGLYNKPLWSEAELSATKERVRQWLSVVADRDDGRARLAELRSRIAELSQHATVPATLELFVCIMSALVTHERSGGLTPTQTNSYVETAIKLLQANHVSPQSSLGYLYSELHSIQSQLQRREGRHLASLWQQALASRTSRFALPGNAGFQKLAMGRRLMRLGHGDAALIQLQDAIREGLSKTLDEQAKLSILLLLRLRGDFDSARLLLAEWSRDPDLSDRARMDLDWEVIIVESIARSNFRPLLRATKAHKTHHYSGFILEVHLWMRAILSTEFVKDPTSVTSLKRSGLFVESDRCIASVVRLLEKLYDEDYPLERRIEFVGEMLETAQSLHSIDHYLLTQLCAARFLSRHKALDLAAVVILEYETLSQKLSGGRTRDSLGVACDLLERSWYLKLAPKLDQAV